MWAPTRKKRCLMKVVLEGRGAEAEERGSGVHTEASLTLLASSAPSSPPQSLFTLYQVNSHISGMSWVVTAMRISSTAPPGTVTRQTLQWHPLQWVPAPAQFRLWGAWAVQAFLAPASLSHPRRLARSSMLHTNLVLSWSVPGSGCPMPGPWLPSV